MEAQKRSGFLLAPISDSFRFVARHPVTFFGLGLVAAVGRAGQLGAAGEVSSARGFILEVIVEGARLLLLLAALGHGSVPAGIAFVRRLFSGSLRQQTNAAPAQDFNWRRFLINGLWFVVLALAVNGLIHLVAHQSPLLDQLQQAGIVDPAAGPTVIVLFLKNLTVIPFTLVLLPFLTRDCLSPTREGDGSRGSS